jgi:hypothetical protein
MRTSWAKRARQIALLTATLTLLLNAPFVFGPASIADGACPPLGDPTTNDAGTQQATAVPADPTDPNARPDLAWPVVSVTNVTLGSDHGRPVVATVTVRENPVPIRHSGAPSRAATLFGRALALASACTFDTNPSVTIDTPTANGMFAMHMTVYFDRWTVVPGNLWAYVNWQTNVWWSRSDSNYDVYGGQQHNDWNYYGSDCSDVLQHPSASSVPFTPSWPGPTGNSTTYVYNGPMNLWPAIFRPATGNWLQYTNQSTTVAYLGEVYTTLSNSYTPPNRIP